MQTDTEHGRVLIATTDTEAAATLGAEVAALGWAVTEALDGADALAMATDSPGFDAVLLDETLPVFPGLELAAMLRADPAIPAATPLILLTTRAISTRDVEHAGITAVIDKSHPSHYELRELLVDLLARNAGGL